MVHCAKRSEVLKEGLEVRGIALGGGGHRIARVDVSIDGGKSYVPAELDDHGMEKLHKRNYHWSWQGKRGNGHETPGIGGPRRSF